MSAAVLEQRDSSRTLRAHRPKEKASEGAPRVIGGFEILARIGSGAMGTVFKARQQSMDRIVALKVLPPRIAKRDPVFVERLIREARASARLNHPHIVHGIDVGRDKATQLYYFAMEYVDGLSIRQMLDREGVLAEARAVEIVAQVARALECAHQAGIVHRDIKPDNILVARNGAAKLSDLGLAKHRLDLERSSESSSSALENDDSALTQAGHAVGTPYYMSPEQARGEDTAVDGRSDLYALGATLFHMISGRPPFKGTHAKETMRMRLTARAPDLRAFNPKASAGVARVVAKLLERDPVRRYQSPGELLAALDCLDATGVSSGSGSADAEDAGTGRAGTSGLKAGVRRARRKARRPQEGRGSLALILGGGALLAALIVGYLVVNGGSKPGAVQGTKPGEGKTEIVAGPAKTDAPAKLTVPGDARTKTDAGKTPKTATAVVPPETDDGGASAQTSEVVEPETPATDPSTKIESTDERQQPVSPPPSVDPKLAAARKAQAELRTQLAPLIAASRFDEALAKLAGASVQSAFEAVRAEIDAEAELVKALRGTLEQVAAGAKLLADGRAFTLVRADGRTQKVGRDAGWLVRGVEEGKIRLSMPGAENEAATSLKLEDLDTATRRALAALAAENGAADALPWTYAELVSLAAKPEPADAAALQRLRGAVLAARGSSDEAAPAALVMAGWLEQLQARGGSTPAVPIETKTDEIEPKTQQEVTGVTPPKPKLSFGDQAVEIEPPPEPPTGMEKEIEAEYLNGKLRRGAAMAKSIAKSRLELDRGGLMFFDYETASKGYALMGQWMDGMTYADKALQKYKNNGEFLRVLAIGKYGLGNYAEAGTAFIVAERRASSLDKPWCRLMQIAALVHASPENAKRLIPGLAGDTQYLRADGFEPAVMRYFGGSLDEKQLMAEAKKVQKYYEQRERYCRACFFAGIKNLMDGKRGEAKAYFERCAQTDDGYLLEPLFAKTELEALK